MGVSSSIKADVGEIAELLPWVPEVIANTEG